MPATTIPTLPIVLFSLSFGLQAQELPEAKGKELYQKICGSCHSLDVVFKTRTTKEKWQNTVDEMVARGADGTDEQLDIIVDYLAKCFGPRVNVNKADAKELEKQFEISGDEAAGIVKYRQEKGEFKTLDDLKSVSALDFKKVEPLRYRITFAEGAK